MSIPRCPDTSRFALITGACSGIGRAMSRHLAAAGYPLIMVSNRPAELAEAARDLRAAQGVPVHELAIDLARPEAAQSLYQAVREQGLEVDLLVSNAGMFFFGEVADADPARANALLQLHVVTPSLLCTYFGRDLRARRRGHILIVSSISAWRDFPGIAYYGASKKYLRGFANSLRCELSVHGVGVTCLAPGATLTGLYDPGSRNVAVARKLRLMMSADEVARAGLEALYRGEAECMPGLLTKVMTQAAVAVPQVVIDGLRRHGPWMHRR